MNAQINDNIIRSLVLKVDPRIVEAWLPHAKAGPGEAARGRREQGASHRVRPPRAAVAVVIALDDEIPAEE